MYQRDYILRMIEMPGDLIAGIMGLIKMLARGDKKGSLEFSRKSLKLFEFVDRESGTCSFDRMAKIRKLTERTGTV